LKNYDKSQGVKTSVKEIKKKIKAIIFDMDGTIIDTESTWNKITLQILRKEGINVDNFTVEQTKVLYSLSGMGLFNAITTLKKHFDLKKPVENLVKQKLEIANKMLSKINFIDGFVSFHQKLTKHDISTSIATNASPENLNYLIKQMGFEEFFGKNIYCIADVNNKAKPEPDLFLHAAKNLNVLPEECVVFEDSLHGFKAAQAAGMKCIAVQSNGNKHLLDNVHGSIRSYHEAEEVLKKL
jgi:beta-phosphoglucomutase-like phosphatase (HAD superfamily)